MTRNYIIQKGEIIFGDDCLYINDREYKWKRFSTLFFGIAAMVFAIMTLIEFFTSEGKSEFGIIPFALVIGLGVPAIMYRCRLSFSSQLRYDEISKVVIHENPFGLLIADFMLRNSKKRHVVLDMNREGNFERSLLPEFIKELKQRRIETEIR